MQVTYIISDVDRSLALERTLEFLQRDGLQVSAILLSPQPPALADRLRELDIPVRCLTCRGKADWPRVAWDLWKCLRRWRPRLVHCHLRKANLLGLPAAWLAGVPGRFFTRHHGGSHHKESPRGVREDRWCAWMATGIVAPSRNVVDILTERDGVPSSKVTLIHHGFHWPDYASMGPEGRRRARRKYALTEEAFVVGAISRAVEDKGLQYLIPAFAALRRQVPRAVLLLANATGPYAAEVRALLAELPADSYRSLDFEPEVGRFYAALDAFVHVPVQADFEAFGQTYVEALAAALPAVFTLSGVAPEFVRDEENALVVSHRDAPAIEAALLRLYQEPELAERLRRLGPVSVQRTFGMPEMVTRLRRLYEL